VPKYAILKLLYYHTKRFTFFRVHVSEEGNDLVISLRSMNAHEEVEI